MKGDPSAAVISDTDWNKAVLLLPTLGPRIEGLIGDLLDLRGIHTHSISHRVKARPNAERKMISKSDGYLISDMTDLLGLRVITYFEDEVDQVASVIEEEFEVDHENSVDKRSLLDPEKFGYLSLHYVAQLPAKRCGLAEYRRFEGQKFEIQIRSILQHAWAEIEHDLGYKSEGALPRSVRRRFSRLAGLLEIADTEFTGIRDNLNRHEEAVDEAFRENKLDVAIDQDAVFAFIRKSDLVRSMDKRVAEIAGRRLSKTPLSKRVVDAGIVERLQGVGYRTIEEVANILESNEQLIVELAGGYYRGRPGPLRRGMVLAFAPVAQAVLKRETPEEAETLLAKVGFPRTLSETLQLLDLHESISEGSEPITEGPQDDVAST